MIAIGVTGGVGTGKSTVARMFGRLGARVLDADRITHQLMRPGTPVWRRIRSSFGEKVLAGGGAVRRKLLGSLVFGHPRRLARLTRIIHPAVRLEMKRRMKELKRLDPGAVVVLDIPLLLEAGSAYRTDALVVVSAPQRVVARRLHQRSGWSAAELSRRIASQLPLREKTSRADFVVANGGSMSLTRRQVLEIWKKVVK